jgi:hypothetical protein
MPLASGLPLCSIISLPAGLAGTADGVEPGVQPMATAPSRAAAARRAARVFDVNVFRVFMGSSPGWGSPIESRVGLVDDSAMTIR